VNQSNAYVDPTPFECVPHWLLLDTSVTANALRVWLVLRKHRNYTTGECWPSRRRLATMCGMDVKTIQKCLSNLTEVGAVTIIGRRKKDGSRDSNLYHVHWDRWGKNSSTVGAETDTGVGSETVQELRPIMNKEGILRSIEAMEDGPEHDAAYLAFLKGKLA
jgi:hypothetical protein